MDQYDEDRAHEARDRRTWNIRLSFFVSIIALAVAALIWSSNS
jgi:hypothetical protein